MLHILSVCVCVCVALVIQHAEPMCCIILSCDFPTLPYVTCPALPYVSTLSHKWLDFQKHKECVF